QDICYSARYDDDGNLFTFRQVVLPKAIAQLIPAGHLMSEKEWRTLGVQQSAGWEHFMTHAPEPHILHFRRN
ncbi:Skp1-Skp2-Cks1 in complex with A P27 peptide, partial [Geranomyces variabilis]